MGNDVVTRVIFLGDSASAVRSIRTLEGSTSSLGRAFKLLSGAVAVGLVSSLGVATVKAAKFQSAMEKIHTQAGATQKEVDKLSKSVVGLAPKVGIGPEELAKGLFHLESVGLRGAKAMDALTVAAKGAQIGGSDLESTATALGSAWLVNIKGAGDLHKVMGLLNATVGAGNVRMEDLVQALGTGVLPAAKSAGLSIQDVMGALAVFTDEGYQASSAAAQFSTALHFLTNPSSKAEAALKGIGIANSQLASDLRKPQGLLVALRDLSDHMSKLSAVDKTKVLGDILPGGRGRILLTLINQLDRYHQKLGQIDKTSRQFGADWVATTKTAAFQWDRLKSGLDALAISVGTLLLPPVTLAVTEMSKLVGWFAKLANAPNIHVAIDIAKGGLQNLRTDLDHLLFGGEFKIKPKLDLSGAGGFRLTGQQSQGIVDKISSSLQGVDWRKVGDQVGQGISKSIRVSADFLNHALDAMVEWIRGHQGELADIGATLLLSVLATLGDPSFWLRHWELILSIALIALPEGKIAEIGGKIVGLLIRPFERLLGPGLGRAAAGAILTLEKVFARLPDIIARPLLRALAEIEASMGSWVGRLLGLLGRLASAGFNKLPGVIQKAFKLAAIFSFIAVIQDVVGWIQDLIGWIKKIPTDISIHIHVPGAGLLGGVAGAVGSIPGVGRSLHALHADGGIVQGFADGGVVPLNMGVRGKDSVPAILTPGEMVLTERHQSALGGQAFLARLFGFDGASGPAFATGGIAGSSPKVKRPPKLPKRAPKHRKTLNPRPGSQGKVAAQLEAINDFQETIRERETDYSFLTDKYSLDDSNLLLTTTSVDPATGQLTDVQTVDTAAVARESGEDRDLIEAKKKLRTMYSTLRQMYAKLVALLRAAIVRLRKAIKAAQEAARDETEKIKGLRGDLSGTLHAQARDQHELDGLHLKLKPTKAERLRIKVLEQQIRADKHAAETTKNQISDAEKKRTGYQQQAATYTQLRSGYISDIDTYKASEFDATNDVRNANLDVARLEKDLGDVTGTAVTPTPAAPASTSADQSALIAELRAQLGQSRLALGIQGAQLPILGSFQKGTIHVPETGLYMLHAGEQVRQATVASTPSARDSSPVVVHLSFDGDAAWLSDYVTAKVVSNTGRVSIEQGRAADRHARERRV